MMAVNWILLFSQTMYCTICHYVSQAYNFGSTTKKRKGLITYNQQHGTTSMKKHVTFEHGDVWARWKNVNLNLVAEDDQCWEKSKHRSIVGHGAITYQYSLYERRFGAKEINGRLPPVFVAKSYMPISVLRINGWGTWSCIKILELCFQIKSKWFSMPFLN